MKATIDALARAFARIATTRMAGLPLNHPKLAVEAAGFRDWQGKWLGVLITPWAINLVLLPASDPEFHHLAADVRQRWSFPGGDFEFMGGFEPECGAYQFCSLLSPVSVTDIADQAVARAMAEEVLARLLVADSEVPAASREQARLAGRSTLAAPMSRRGFLTGGRAG